MGACLPDYMTLNSMGFLSPCVTEKNFNKLLLGSPFVGEARKQLRILDEQEAIHRYLWEGLPKGLYSSLIERILYYRYKGMFFKLGDKGYFLPVALENGIDYYGRFFNGRPLPFTGSTAAKNGDTEEFLPGISFKLLYDVPEGIADDVGVLLYDYSLQMSQTGLTRQSLQESTLQTLADILAYIRTSLRNISGVRGMRVQSEDEQSNVKAASESIERAALNGQTLVPVISPIEIQELMNGDIAKPDMLFMAFQALNNYRLSLYGLKNGGVYQKNTTYQNNSQVELNTSADTAPLYDGLILRQRACEIANAAFGWNMSVKVNPLTTEQQQGPAQQPELIDENITEEDENDA